MADAKFEDARLAAVYDALEGGRDDLGAYVAIADELGARSVLDVGCGTGVFALLLAAGGRTVVGVDPARASLDVARGKPGAGRVRWIHGDATDLPPLQVDLVTMTGNVAQAIVAPAEWTATLAGIRAALRPGGHLVFETRDPARRAWVDWTHDPASVEADVPGIGRVHSRAEVLDVTGPLVSFGDTTVFARDGAVLTSTSTLRFRQRGEIEADLAAAGFAVREVRGAPDRPGREFVFLAEAG